ncbi:hypothetical protein EVAR_82241_1 [Eumeta japonica]|uniref:Uncharacterized protein n=1 Tax=Eumeta variegata TaxID=151549 RepID=A0A4C1VYZ3_EUMVA|nr:hypothetical protein EVAR_82241_1 [Eumeta japonica]
MSFILLGVKIVHTIECASTDVLRIDEGTMLFPPERDDLARLLQEYQDIFTQGGGPTSFAEHRIDRKESAERQQDLRKSLKDKSRRDGTLIVGDLVLMKTHVLSNSIKGVTSKFVPKRDGPYLIHKKVSPTTYLLAYPETPDKPIGEDTLVKDCSAHLSFILNTNIHRYTLGKLRHNSSREPLKAERAHRGSPAAARLTCVRLLQNSM